MGNSSCKDLREIVPEIVSIIEEKDKKCTSTPTYRVTCPRELDPRSPTDGISRTPIEVLEIHKQLQVNSSLRRRWNSEPDLTPLGKRKSVKSVFHVLNNDPRSPTFGIHRTPIQVACDSDYHYSVKDESVAEYTHSINGRAGDVHIISDCRSPTLEICRTPIQVPEVPNRRSNNVYVNKPLFVLPENEHSSTYCTSPILSKLTQRSGPFVYVDEAVCFTNNKTDIELVDNRDFEKENELHLRRKLFSSPDLNISVTKVRTPLGSRSNFQDSPSQILKMRQVQKLDQGIGNDIENTPPNLGLGAHAVSTMKPTAVEWDNKDVTLIM